MRSSPKSPRACNLWIPEVAVTDAGQQDMSGLFRGTDGTHPEPKGRAADWTEETSEPASERRGKLGGLKRPGGAKQQRSPRASPSEGDRLDKADQPGGPVSAVYSPSAAYAAPT